MVIRKVTLGGGVERSVNSIENFTVDWLRSHVASVGQNWALEWSIDRRGPSSAYCRWLAATFSCGGRVLIDYEERKWYYCCGSSVLRLCSRLQLFCCTAVSAMLTCKHLLADHSVRLPQSYTYQYDRSRHWPIYTRTVPSCVGCRLITCDKVVYVHRYKKLNCSFVCCSPAFSFLLPLLCALLRTFDGTFC